MPDLHRMERTWLCSVVFTDIVKYSSQSVELQMKWKTRFNGYLASAIREVPEDERVILDTGDGAAICFLGAPEAAMFAALDLWQSFVQDEREQPPGLRVRIGINLGPVKLIKDINGALNAIGDGINAGQRIMSFAGENQILVSQSFYEVVSRVSDDYKDLFKLKGVETDKHVREHTVYNLYPPGSERPERTMRMQVPVLPLASQPTVTMHGAGAPSPIGPQPSAPQSHSKKSSVMPILVGGIAALAIVGVGAWYFLGREAQPTNVISTPTQQVAAERPAPPKPVENPVASSPASLPPTSPTPTQPAPKTKEPEPSASAPVAGSTATTATPPSIPASKPAATPVDAGSVDAEPPATVVSADALSAFQAARQMLDHNQAAAAIPHFSDAIRINPNYIEAYVGRAEARRQTGQYEVSLDDCNKIMQLKPSDPRAYNCRGHGYLLMKQYEKSIQDLDEAVRLNPAFVLALENRANAHVGLQQYPKAIDDYTRAIQLRPNNGEFYFRRAAAHTNLKQYEKAMQDYTEAIRCQPNMPRSYFGRAEVEDQLGNHPAAIADRKHAKGLRQK